jgi:hypothetical protein
LNALFLRCEADMADFADQGHKPKQTAAPMHQSLFPQGSKETPILPGNDVDYSKIPKAFQRSYSLTGSWTEPPKTIKTQSNAAVPEQGQKPKQGVVPTPQGLSPEGSKETPILPGGDVDYSKIPKAFQRSYSLTGSWTEPLETIKTQSNTVVPEQAQQSEPKAAQPTLVKVASATVPASNPSALTIAAAPNAALNTAAPKPIQITQETKGTATLDSGQRALAGKAFNKFLRQQLKKRSPELAAKVLGASVADGPFPIGEALSLGFTVQTFYDIYQDYVKLYPPQADPSETFSPTQSQSTTAGGTHSTHKQAPINLGTVPQMGTSTNDPVDAFLKAQEAQIQQSDRQMAAKHQREAQLAVSADGRQQQRNAVDGLMRDKLYKVNSQENLSLYQTWLLQNDPKFLNRMNQQAGARYDTLTHQGKDLQFEGDAARQSFRQSLLSHTMYQNDLRAREMIEYSSMELNLGQVTNQGTGFNQKKLAQIRGNFDAVVAGGYEKKLEPKVIKYAEAQANAAYVKETGSKEVDRNSPLWKTLRNVELLKYDRTLWNTVQEAPAGMMTNPNDPSLGSNALNRPGQGSTLKVPTSTAHPAGEGQQKQQPVGDGFSNTVNPELVKPQGGFPTNQKVDGVTNVFDYTTDYRKNYELANGPIPAGSQIHHITPRAVFNASGLAQEWVQRGMTKLDYPENLQALPQTQDAYDKSSIKIQHSGSHAKWNAHAADVFDRAKTRLEGQYGSLNKVPDDVMKQTKDDVMQQLREDLLDKDLGIEKGWVKPQPSGMDKISQSQNLEQIG